MQVFLYPLSSQRMQLLIQRRKRSTAPQEPVSVYLHTVPSNGLAILPLILLHGALGGRSCWDEQADQF